MMTKIRLSYIKCDIQKPLIKILAALLLSLSVIGLSSVIISIYVSKPIGDDFGAITYYRPDVWLLHTWQSLMTTGRYGQSLLGALVYGLFGNKVSSSFPLITLAWFAALVYLYLKSFSRKHLQVNTSRVGYISAIFATLLVFLTLFVNKSVENINPPTWMTYQLFFWPSGIVTYTLPILILLTVVYVIFIRKNKLSSLIKYSIFAIAIFLTGLFNETQPATLIGISIATLCLSFIPILKALRPYKVHFLITGGMSLLALLTLFLSPGSQKRQAATGVFERGNVVSGILHNFWLSIDSLMFRPRELLLIIFAGLLIAMIVKVHTAISPMRQILLARWGLLVGAVSIILTLGTLICSLTLLAIGYGEHTSIYARTLLMPQICYVFGLTIFASSVCLLLINKLRSTLVTILTAVSILLFIVLAPSYLNKIVSQLNASIGYAAAWNDQEHVIEQDKQEHKPIVYLPQSAAGIGDGFSLSCTGPYAGSTEWLNEQIQDYYSVSKVCSIQDKGILEKK